jgi:hypothetical protein
VEVDVGVVLVDVVVEVEVESLVVFVVVLRQWSSFTPPWLPCGSQSFPFVDGSGLQGFPVLPWEQSPWPGGSGGFAANAVAVYTPTPSRTASARTRRTLWARIR